MKIKNKKRKTATEVAPKPDKTRQIVQAAELGQQSSQRTKNDKLCFYRFAGKRSYLVWGGCT